MSIFKVNPSFEFTQFGGERVTRSARDVFMPSLSFDKESEANESANLEAFLNAAWEKGWLYYTTIGGYPVFAKSLETAIKGN